MNETSLSKSIAKLKNEFIKTHRSRSLVYEIIPLSYSPELPIEETILSGLNNFAQNNTIYFEPVDVHVFNIRCKSYEGDINQYWLSSKKYDTNYQPFYPTWILSAYALTLEAKRLGFREVVDIGSGDGRISYCARLLGMKSVSLEIDSELVNLQYQISDLTKVKYDILNEDATTVDYSSLNLSKPLFFISGLPELGEMLANHVLSKVNGITKLKCIAGFNFMGSHTLKEYSRDKTGWGWGKIIEKFDLDVVGCLTLPTLWTNDQQIDTPYVYTKCKNKNLDGLEVVK
jgi:hypothetical protein